jgi:hypothetical protein
MGRDQSQTLDRIGRAQHAMRKIARQLGHTEGGMDLADRPPGIRWSPYNRLADRLQHQNSV